jgi:recombination protein U
VDTFALSNIHEHQVEFMKDFEAQGGISFFLLYYSKKEEYYYLRLEELLEFWKRAKLGGRKSFRKEELTPEYFVKMRCGGIVPFLDLLKKDLEGREE